MAERFCVFRRIGLLGLGLILCALGGCTQVTVMRHYPSGATACETSGAGCANGPSAAEQEPIIQPPTPKFHPVPTRPVFSPRPPYNDPAEGLQPMRPDACDPQLCPPGGEMHGVPDLEVCPVPDQVYVEPDRLTPIIEVETPRPMPNPSTEDNAETEQLPAPGLIPPESTAPSEAPNRLDVKIPESSQPTEPAPELSPFPDELPDPPEDSTDDSAPANKSAAPPANPQTNVALSGHAEPVWKPAAMIEIEVPAEPPAKEPASLDGQWRPSRLRR